MKNTSPNGFFSVLELARNHLVRLIAELLLQYLRNDFRAFRVRKVDSETQRNGRKTGVTSVNSRNGFRNAAIIGGDNRKTTKSGK